MILVVDDDSAVRLSLKLLLSRQGHEVALTATPAEAISVVRARAPQLVLMDMNFSRSTTGDEGITLLRQVKVLRPEVPVILITAWGNIPLAVEGIKHGAFDFITKPWDNVALMSRVECALKLSQPSDAARGAFDRSRIIGSDPALLAVLDVVERVAPTDAPVLVMGENGTGKELIAEAVHANSQRRDGPLVKVNLGGIATSLFESEMFGHKKGAFTGAVADREGRFAMAEGGTIFLDEVGDLDLNSQVKLLRVLQEHTYEALGDSRTRRADVRVVCATNADLPAMVQNHTFREDLFYRINLITVTLPPLRERADDIPLLTRHLLRKAAAKAGLDIPEITPEAMELLKCQPWPGNIRQLGNVVERALLMCGGRQIDTKILLANGMAADVVSARTGGLESAERQAIETALASAGGNLSRAAAMLGITRQALYRRLAKYGITP